MMKKYWLQRIIEACLLYVILYYCNNIFFVQLDSTDRITNIGIYSIFIFLYTSLIILFLQFFKLIIKIIFSQAKIGLIKTIIKDFYVVLVICLITEIPLVLSVIVSIFMKFNLGNYLPLLNQIIQEKNLLSLGVFIGFLCLPFIVLLLVSICLFSIMFFLYFIVQGFDYKYNSKLGKLNFIILQITKALGIFVLPFILWFLVSLGLSLFLSSSSFIWNNSSSNIIRMFFHLAFTYIGLNVLLFFASITFILLPLVLGITTSAIKDSRLKTKFEKIFLNFIWLYTQKSSAFIKALLPYSLLGIFSDYIYIYLIQTTLFYSSIMYSSIQASESRKIAFDLVQELIRKKSFFMTIKELYEIVKDVAYKFLIFGDLKQADIIYAELWKLVKDSKRYGYLDEPFNEVCSYYIETFQYNLLTTIINEASTLVAENKLSRLTYLSMQMKGAFSKKKYSDSLKANSVPAWLNWYGILDILCDLPDVSNKNNFLLYKSDEDFFKFFLSQRKVIGSDDYNIKFIKANRQDLMLLLATLQLLFERQHKIYWFVSTQDSQYKPNDNELQLSLNKAFNIDILGINITINNPFLKENIKLIPLAYLLSENSLVGTALDTLINDADAHGRQIDLAFLKCCKGKLLIKNRSIQEGLDLLQQGIKLYEGIRYSVSTDQIGVGFGSNYLEYYDWAIDGLMRENNFCEAFEYVEKSTARALLDLVSRKTSRSGSFNQSNEVTRLIGEIQEIDHNIYFSQSQTYETPFFAKFLPSALKRKLKRDFYKDKKTIKNRLVKQRNSLVEILKSKDPVASTLVDLNPLSWGDESKPREKFIPFEYLWSKNVISEQEAILCFHVIHKISFDNQNKLWEKIFCFALYMERGLLRLHHHVVDNPERVLELQQLCMGIANELKELSKIRSIPIISDNIIIPLLEKLPDNCNTLTIAANSDLQFFPWSILYDQDDNQLIERFQIRTTPSLSLLYLLKQREDFRHTEIPTQFLVTGVVQYPNLGDYLFWSGIEVDRICELYTSASVLKDGDVDKYFAEKFKHAQVIHYSGHGNYLRFDSKSQESYQKLDNLDALDKIYLSLYNKKITAAQILDGALENPDAKVMILSACLTGTGDLTSSGSEILGLERALFHAGLSSLITTLWSVAEFSTALLMLKLHCIWRSHNNTLETLAFSLQQAQIWLKDLTWRQLKQEFPKIEQDISKCIETYQMLITFAKEDRNERIVKRLENRCEYYRKVSKWLESGSTNRPFGHPYYWAAFQVKGMG